MERKSILVLGLIVAVATPVFAEPMGTSNDGLKLRYYPEESLKKREEGTVHYRVAINRKGEPESCEVTASSGYARLDEATCTLIVLNAKFNRVDVERQPKHWYYDGKVDWRIDTPNS